MKKILIFLLSIFIVTSFISCSKKENSKTASGKIVFTVGTQSNKALKSALAANARSILISIEDTSGKSIYDSEVISLINFNGTYISQPISLNIGNYNLTKFMVIDSAGKVIYATPVKGSSKAYLVQNPLPISFTISENNTTKLTPEVLSTYESTPAEFGYFDASFQVVNTFDFLVSVMVYDAASQNFKLTDASITISDSVKDLYTLPLSAITNKITVNDGYGTYILTINKNGYSSYSKTYTRDSLKNCFNSPLIVTLASSSVDITSGLVAYYPFNGNANDASGNGNNGTVNGATLCADRYGNASSAYSFDGISNNITIPYNTSFYNNNYTYSLWYKPTQLPAFGSNYYILSIGSDGGDQTVALVNQYSGLGTGFQCGGYSSSPLSTVQAATEVLPSINNWYHIVAVRTNDSVKLYINGSIAGQNTTNNKLPYYSLNGLNFTIGSRYNNTTYSLGIIDEVKIYNKALNIEEVNVLYNLNK